jgi:hypothetical protein
MAGRRYGALSRPMGAPLRRGIVDAADPLAAIMWLPGACIKSVSVAAWVVLARHGT